MKDCFRAPPTDLGGSTPYQNNIILDQKISLRLNKSEYIGWNFFGFLPKSDRIKTEKSSQIYL